MTGKNSKTKEIPDAYACMNRGILYAIKYTQVESWKDAFAFLKAKEPYKNYFEDLAKIFETKIKDMETDLLKFK